MLKNRKGKISNLKLYNIKYIVNKIISNTFVFQ